MAVIMDGNGRWAKPWKGIDAAQKRSAVIRVASNLGSNISPSTLFHGELESPQG